MRAEEPRITEAVFGVLTVAGEVGVRRAALALLLAAALPLLTGCGRAGPPRPPGPREAITYPRVYPAPDPLPPSGVMRP